MSEHPVPAPSAEAKRGYCAAHDWYEPLCVYCRWQKAEAEVVRVRAEERAAVDSRYRERLRERLMCEEKLRAAQEELRQMDRKLAEERAATLRALQDRMDLVALLADKGQSWESIYRQFRRELEHCNPEAE